MPRPPGNPLRPTPRGTDSLLQDLWETRAWRLFPVFLVYVAGLTLLLPFVPTLMTNYFASARAGTELHCERFGRGEAPVACHDAHADVVLWASWTSFASNTVVSVVLVPLLGNWSDVHGRRPFLLLALGLASAPLLVVLGHVTTGFPLKWYYLVQVLTGSVSTITPSLAYLADLLAPAHRAAAFGLVMASFSLAVFIGPALGALMTPASAAWAALGTLCVCWVYVALAIPESLTPAAKEEARQRREESRAAGGGLLEGASAALRILLRSPLFKKLTLCMMLYGMVSEGMQDLLIQYLQLKLGFGVADQAAIFMVFGAGGLVVQAFLLRALLALAGEQRVLCLGLASSMVQLVVLALATARWQAFGAILLGTLGSMSFPTISSIKSNNAQEHEQGAVQGALYGARALASGCGPLVFAWLFKAFTSSQSELPYFPGAPFVLASVLMLGALGVAATIPANAGGSAGSVHRISWRQLRTFKALPVEEEPGPGGLGEAGAGGSRDDLCSSLLAGEGSKDEGNGLQGLAEPKLDTGNSSEDLLVGDEEDEEGRPQHGQHQQQGGQPGEEEAALLGGAGSSRRPSRHMHDL